MPVDPLALSGAITGVVGTVLGGVSLFLHWRTYRADRPELRIEATMGIAESAAHPESHPFLEVTLRNTGRRVMRIHDVWIDVPVKPETTINPDGTRVTLSEERVNLFGRGRILLLEEHERFVLRHDPFPNPFAKRLGSEKVKLKVEDSLGKIHEITFQPSVVPNSESV